MFVFLVSNIIMNKKLAKSISDVLYLHCKCENLKPPKEEAPLADKQALRLPQSQNKQIVENEMKEITAPFQHNKFEFIKNPTVAEFIGLSANSDFTE